MKHYVKDMAQWNYNLGEIDKRVDIIDLASHFLNVLHEDNQYFARLWDWDTIAKGKNTVYFNKEENTFTQIKEMKSSNLTNFEVDRIIKSAINEFNVLKEKYEKLKDNDLLLKTEIELTSSETEVMALKKYYNDIITEYNKYARVFPSVLVAFISRYKQKNYFDGKDLNDNIKNDFKL